MKSVSKVVLGLGFVVALAAVVAPVQAACPGTDASFWQFSQATELVSNPGWCTVNGFGQTPGYGCFGTYNTAGAIPTAITANLSGTFWVTGEGNPGAGGTDGGSLGRDAWVYPAGYGYGDALTGYYGLFAGYESYGPYGYAMLVRTVNWNEGGIDGCVSDNAATPNRCLCVAFSDEINGQGYFATAGGVVAGNGNTDIGSSGQIQLQPIPKLGIVGSSRAGESVNLTTQLPDASAGVNDGGCQCAPVAYNVYTQRLARGATPPDSRSLSSGWTLAATSAGPGAQTMVNVDCTGQDSDVYLGASLVFADGFETSVVSENSTRVECGPQLATPDDNRIRPGDRPTLRDRRGRGGR